MKDNSLSWLNRRHRIFFIFFIGFIITSVIFYRIAFYTPPLLDTGKRNIIEKTMDFLGFSWHMSMSAIYEAFLNKRTHTRLELAKASWYRIDYFPKHMNIDNKDLALIAEAYRERGVNGFVEKIYSYLSKNRKQ